MIEHSAIAAAVALSLLAQPLVLRDRLPADGTAWGPYIGPADAEVVEGATFSPEDRVVGTYYFYWYDIHTNEHFIDHDGTDALTDHPATTEDYSYKSAAWHERELRDVMAAGLDYILPVYWGSPDPKYREGFGAHLGWSFIGLSPLIEACDKLAAAGVEPPKIGLFYDTSTLQHNPSGYHADLTTPAGKEWLYGTIRDFYSAIPARCRFMVDGRPVVWLYAAAFARRQDPAALDYVRQHFERDFGVEPYIVKEVSWEGNADSTYAWGAALGPRIHGIAAVGPGYDHSAVPGRQPLVRDREGGRFYEDSWRRVLMMDPDRRPRIAVVETWNELHEGTEICDTKEYGRQYIELTAKYADLFRQGANLKAEGPFSGADEVVADFTAPEQDGGLALRVGGDGLMEAAEVGGRRCQRTTPNPHGDVRYVYLDLHWSFAFDEAGLDLEVTVDYCDAGATAFAVQYDSNDPGGSVREGAFKDAGRNQAVTGSGEWRRATFLLQGGRFANRGNDADFRLAVFGGDMAVSRVVARRAR